MNIEFNKTTKRLIKSGLSFIIASFLVGLITDYPNLPSMISNPTILGSIMLFIYGAGLLVIILLEQNT